KLFLNLEPIRSEALHCTRFEILKPMLSAPAREGVTALWYGDARRECQGFKVHTDWHIAPKSHWLSEDAIFHASRSEVRSQRQSIWTRSDNRNIGPGFHPNNHLPRLDFDVARCS